MAKRLVAFASSARPPTGCERTTRRRATRCSKKLKTTSSRAALASRPRATRARIAVRLMKESAARSTSATRNAKFATAWPQPLGGLFARTAAGGTWCAVRGGHAGGWDTHDNNCTVKNLCGTPDPAWALMADLKDTGLPKRRRWCGWASSAAHWHNSRNGRDHYPNA